jgi:hypothetical protein
MQRLPWCYTWYVGPRIGLVGFVLVPVEHFDLVAVVVLELDEVELVLDEVVKVAEQQSAVQ